MARADTYTLLALDRFARLAGITPPHFNQATGTTVFPLIGDCGDVWWQFPWVNADQVSRDELASTMADVEHDIAMALGYWPAPIWIYGEPHSYSRPYRPDSYGTSLNVRGQHKSIQAKNGKIISPGTRATTLITSGAGVVFSDPDGDGYSERATVTTPTTLTETCELHCYFFGHNGEQVWEIRPPRSVTITGGNVVFTFDAWLLLDPDLWDVYPTGDDMHAIDLQAIANYVTRIDVYREYTDTTAVSAVFYWENDPASGFTACSCCGGSGCVACTLQTQDGCIHIRDVDLGLVVPLPATYSATSAAWAANSWGECREPDQVTISYYAGNLSREYSRGLTCDPLSNEMAQAITWMTIARLERPLCACNNSHVMAMDLKRDLAFTPADGGNYILSDDDLSNPFGTRKGEVMAWRKISKLIERTPSVANI
jgi:hypothetical protein